jgi:hypothetical protein
MEKGGMSSTRQPDPFNHTRSAQLRDMRAP